MILCVDIGNTNIKFGGFEDDKLTFFASIATNQKLTFEQYAIEIKNLLKLFDIPEDGFEGAAISSVVPAVTRSMRDAIEYVCKVTPLVVSPGVKTGLNLKASNAVEIGADIVCGAVAIANKYPLPCVVFSLGTATTVFAVNENKEFIGGMLIPGVMASLNALSASTAMLPAISLDADKPKMFTTDTVEAMTSGIIYSTVSMIDGLSQRIEHDFGQKSTFILSGGLNSVFLPYLSGEFKVDDNIVLEGLLHIYKRNSKR